MKRTEDFDINDIANEYGLDIICVYDFHNKSHLALIGFDDINEANEIAENYGMEFIIARKNPRFDHFEIEHYTGNFLNEALYRDDDSLMYDYENRDVRHILREYPKEEEMLDMIKEAFDDIDNNRTIEVDDINEIFDNAEQTLKESMYNLHNGWALLVSSKLKIIDKVETDNLFEYYDECHNKVVLALVKED